MKVWKKLSAVALALVMVLALGATAFATTNPATLETGTVNSEDRTGQQGTFNNPDTPLVQEKTVTLAKEITAYNPETITVKAPTISYTYTITAATVTENETTFQLTDAAGKHTSNAAVTVPVKAGVSPTAVIVAGNTSSDAGTGNGTVAWTSTEDLSASSTGVANYKGITFNFSNIDFGSAGVYRYVVTETLTSAVENNTYPGTGVTDVDSATNGKHVRYIDVYVMDTPDDNDEETPAPTGANKWTIYGFTCFYNNGTFTDSNKGTVAVKTTGFVAGTTNGTTEVKADSYYTYNFTVSKTVVNDSYSATNHAFPFTVIFSNTAIKKTVGIITDKTNASNADGFIGTDNVISGVFASDLSSNAFDGVLTIKHGETMKYVGIPCGTAIEVYETNDVNGVTYKVDTRVDSGAATTDNAVTSTTTKPDMAVAQTTKADYQSTRATITTTADVVASVVEHSIAITNTLLNISPTGVTLRYAPYLAMLGAGVVALPLTLRKREEEI